MELWVCVRYCVGEFWPQGPLYIRYLSAKNVYNTVTKVEKEKGQIGGWGGCITKLNQNVFNKKGGNICKGGNQKLVARIRERDFFWDVFFLNAPQTVPGNFVKTCFLWFFSNPMENKSKKKDTFIAALFTPLPKGEQIVLIFLISLLWGNFRIVKGPP